VDKKLLKIKRMYKREDLITAKEYLFESGKDIADTFTFNDVVHYMTEWNAKNCNLQNVIKSVCLYCGKDGNYGKRYCENKQCANNNI
jgi:hypothetical protein